MKYIFLTFVTLFTLTALALPNLAQAYYYSTGPTYLRTPSQIQAAARSQAYLQNPYLTPSQAHVSARSQAYLQNPYLTPSQRFYSYQHLNYFRAINNYGFIY